MLLIQRLVREQFANATSKPNSLSVIVVSLWYDNRESLLILRNQNIIRRFKKDL